MGRTSSFRIAIRDSWKKRYLINHEPIIIFAVSVLLLLPCVWCEMSITGQDEYWLSLRTPMETLERESW
ncbi:MAG: hypothetical protein E3J28_05355 [Desulfobacteraceae bacterium]|nr:MAG: hypothetical protein E3J28_05355 [Desulfobacteraceae bacterium]